MGHSYEKSAADIAAQTVIDELLNRYGYSVRKAAELSAGALTYSRIHDLRNGLKSPLKISESLAFAKIFNVEPEEFAAEIYNKAREIEEQNTRLEDSRSDFGLVANRDGRKFEEMEDYYE